MIETGYTVVSNVVHSQVARHQPFGGVVPEIASREHLTKIGVVVEKALEESGGVSTIDAIAKERTTVRRGMRDVPEEQVIIRSAKRVEASR